jgi:inosine/xanthosine triphosphate pyrophosphatase family protein
MKPFGILTEMLSGNPGIYSHTSVRSDKNDMNPQSELTLMLKTLEFPTAI